MLTSYRLARSAKVEKCLDAGVGLLLEAFMGDVSQVLVEMATGAGSGKRTAAVVSVPVVIHCRATTSRAACFASRATNRRNPWGI